MLFGYLREYIYANTLLLSHLSHSEFNEKKNITFKYLKSCVLVVCVNSEYDTKFMATRWKDDARNSIRRERLIKVRVTASALEIFHEPIHLRPIIVFIKRSQKKKEEEAKDKINQKNCKWSLILSSKYPENDVPQEPVVKQVF